MKRTFMSAIAVMAMAGIANANGIWLSAGGNGGAVGGLVSIPTVGGSGQIDLWLQHDGNVDGSTNPFGTGWSIGFDGFGQTRDNDAALLGAAHFQTTSFNDVVTGNLGSLVPNDPTRGGANTFGSSPAGFGYVFAIVHNGPFGPGSVPGQAYGGYFGGPAAVKADEIIITGTAENVLPDSAFLAGGALAPTWVEVTDYNGTISTEILLPVNNLSKSPTVGQVDVQVLPEPASLALLLIGGLAAARRRR